MKKCNPFCCGWWPFLLLPLLLLLLAIFFYWRSIEADVAANANQALTDNQLSWATADTHSHGRNVHLQGVAESEAQKDLAIETALSAKGVRKVIWEGQVMPPEPEPLKAEPLKPEPVAPEPVAPPQLRQAEIIILKNGETISIAGASGTALWPYEALFIEASDYQESSDFEPLEELNPLISVAQSLPDGATITVAGGELTLSGTIDALGKKKQITLATEAAFNGPINNQLQVKLAEVEAAQLVSKTECQTLFDDLSQSESINFKTAEAIILPESYPLLDRFTQLSLRCPDAQFLVSGHTDNTGNPVFNRTISLERAQAVVNHIVNSGIDSSRFRSEGLGQTQPIADNATVEGRAKNRRVEFKITN